MKLNHLIKRIKSQQDAMGYTEYIEESVENRMDYLRDISLALIIELVEMLQCLPWKPWKSIEEQRKNTDVKEASKEYSDILVFLIDILLIINPAMDLEKVMRDTLAKIDNRIRNNYGRQDTTGKNKQQEK